MTETLRRDLSAWFAASEIYDGEAKRYSVRLVTGTEAPFRHVARPARPLSFDGAIRAIAEACWLVAENDVERSKGALDAVLEILARHGLLRRLARSRAHYQPNVAIIGEAALEYLIAAREAVYRRYKPLENAILTGRVQREKDGALVVLLDDGNEGVVLPWERAIGVQSAINESVSFRLQAVRKTTTGPVLLCSMREQSVAA